MHKFRKMLNQSIQDNINLFYMIDQHHKNGMLNNLKLFVLEEKAL
jgi:hypothetical protein